MHISPRRLRSMAVLAATAMCATVPTITAAHAAMSLPTITLTVNGQTLGNGTPTVSGMMDISATITPAANNPVKAVEFELFGSPYYQTVPLTPGQCDTTCTVPMSFDTSSVLPGATGGVGQPSTSDGNHGLLVRAMTAAGTTTNASEIVDVNNHRPVAEAPSGTAPVFHPSKTMTWTLTPAVSPTAPAGSTISDVELEAPGTPIPVTHFTKNTDGTWTVTVDTSALNGLYTVVAVATDSNGVISSPQGAQLVADNGFALSVPSASQVDTPDWSTVRLVMAYPNDWAGCSEYLNGSPVAGPTNVELQVDGKVWQDSPVDPGGSLLGINSAGNCVIPATGNEGTAAKPLPYGKHALTWVVTDANGVQESVTQQVTVAAPLTATWPTGTQILAAGSTIHAAATVTSPDGFSALQSWSVTDQNGVVLASGTGATQPSVTLPTPATSIPMGSLTLNLTSNFGLTTSRTFNYRTEWPTAVFAHLSATSVASGTWVKLSASAWAKEWGKWTTTTWSADLQYQWSVPGSGVWHNGSNYPRANSASLPSTWIHAGSNACFRAEYTVGGVVLPATSAPVCLTVKP